MKKIASLIKSFFALFQDGGVTTEKNEGPSTCAPRHFERVSRKYGFLHNGHGGKTAFNDLGNGYIQRRGQPFAAPIPIPVA